MQIFVYDGSFTGFLTAVFEVYEYRAKAANIVTETNYVASFFSEKQEVISCTKKAKRVWKAVLKFGESQDASLIYRGFLSELPDMEKVLLAYIQLLFKARKSIAKNFADPQILRLAHINKKIGREKHRMEAFVRFRKTKDALYFATISPDFNVLPLIEMHFTKRYADQRWCIYDLSRKYGIYYDLHKTLVVHLDLPKTILDTSENIFTEEEQQYQKLWKNYFESTNIAARANKKLHQQHVPKRYWKYLSEKALLEW